MTILKMNFLAGILILLIMSIRVVLLQYLPKKLFPVLWSIVLYRLLIPVFISSRFSICTLIYRIKNRMINANIFWKLAFPTNRDIANNLVSDIMSVVDTTGKRVVEENFIKIFWIIGICICMLYCLISHFRCLMDYKMSLPVENAFIDDWMKKHSIRRKVNIRQSDKISTPLTYGVFYPTVLLPKTINWEDEAQLQYILTHEYVHIREFHILFKWLLVFTVCVHWFNPLVWIMYSLANLDIELSCDEMVVWMLGEKIRYAYALTLIEFEEKKNTFSPFANRFSKSLLEERMVLLMKTRKLSLKGIVASIAVVIVLCVVFTTDSGQEDLRAVGMAAQATTSKDTKDIRNCSVDFIKSENIVDMTDRGASKHDVKNGEMVLYEKNGKPWSLKQGEKCCIQVTTEKIFEEGQTGVIGYVVNGFYTDIFSDSIIQNESVEFTVPQDGDYTFYFIGASSDTIHIQSVYIL